MTNQNGSIIYKRVVSATAGLNILMLLAGVILGIRFAAPLIIPNWGWTAVLLSLNTIIYSFLAVLILARHPGHMIGRLFLMTGFFFGLAGLHSGLVALTLELPVHSEQLRGWVNLMGYLASFLSGGIPITLVLQFFPTGHLPSRRWWPITAAVVFGLVGFSIGLVFSPWHVGYQGLLTAGNPLAIFGSQRFFNFLFQLSFVVGVFGLVGSWSAMAVRFHRARGIERIQMKWLIYSVGITILLMFLLTTCSRLPIINSIIGNFFIEPYFLLLLPILFPLSIGIAILRYQLFDIHIVIQRTLVYGTLTTMTLVIYIVMVSGLSIIFQSQTNTVSGLIAAGVIAVLFQPLRERLQQRVNRLLYGERDDPTAVLTQLAQQMETADSPTDILPNLVHTIAHTLKIPHIAIWLPKSERQFEPVATWGESPDHVEMISLTYQNETIGHLVVAPRSPNEPFNHQERQLLNTIAVVTANTVRAVQLSDELRQSRQRIVTAREDERRRLRRDLHDGLGPQLASQTLGLEAVEQLWDTNPDKAHKLLASLIAQAQEAISDVRRLVYDLRPPTLDDLGLIGALRQSASRYENGGLQFSVDVQEPLPDLPAAVETAVYLIAQEAMTNIARHAHASHGFVRLTCANHQLVVEICDDGQGIAPEHHSGVGLQSMRERAAELNGQCVIQPRLGEGTMVEARLPLEVSDG